MTGAFQPSLPSSARSTVRSSTTTERYGYVPDGFTAESYKKFQQEEKRKKAAAKSLGGMGPLGFKSRSMQSFQEAMERGEAKHLMPVFNAKEKVNRGEIRVEDIPYMQRGGSWDNSDVQGAKNRKKWSQRDKEYSAGGYKKEQSVSVFGFGEGLDWTGKRKRNGPAAGEMSIKVPKIGKNYKAPNVNDIKGYGKKKTTTTTTKDKPKKKFFGLF